MLSKKTSILILITITVFTVILGLMLNPIGQPQWYHQFADQRYWIGLPNAMNVLSNIPIALVGMGALYLLFSAGKIQFTDFRERWIWVGVSLGLILTAIGSSDYHLAPDDSRLVWDRIPMTIVFMSYVAALFGERYGVNYGLLIWPVLIAYGFYSVYVWDMHDDLRLYISVQIVAILATLIMLLVHSPYNRSSDLVIVIAFYGLARLCEIYDHEIYKFTKNIVSGHTLKHIAAAVASFWLIRMLWKRKII